MCQVGNRFGGQSAGEKMTNSALLLMLLRIVVWCLRRVEQDPRRLCLRHGGGIYSAHNATITHSTDTWRRNIYTVGLMRTLDWTAGLLERRDREQPIGQWPLAYSPNSAHKLASNRWSQHSHSQCMSTVCLLASRWCVCCSSSLLPKRLASRKITIEDGPIWRTSKKWAGRSLKAPPHTHKHRTNERTKKPSVHDWKRISYFPCWKSDGGSFNKYFRGGEESKTRTTTNRKQRERENKVMGRKEGSSRSRTSVVVVVVLLSWPADK